MAGKENAYADSTMVQKSLASNYTMVSQDAEQNRRVHTQYFSPLTKQRTSHQTPASTIAGDASQFYQGDRTSTADNETQSEKTETFKE